tara:strand:+ start:632 stop:925 length:294 start_codon:yes stop_codon:yes gene_type:complete
MARYNTVICSLESPDGRECTDIFRRPDATFGFEKFRLDAEDCRGWFPIGYYSGIVFNTALAAMTEAQRQIPWLNSIESLSHCSLDTTPTESHAGERS